MKFARSRQVATGCACKIMHANAHAYRLKDIVTGEKLAGHTSTLSILNVNTLHPRPCSLFVPLFRHAKECDKGLCKILRKGAVMEFISGELYLLTKVFLLF